MSRFSFRASISIALVACVVAVTWQMLRGRRTDAQATESSSRAIAERATNEPAIDAMVAELRGPLQQAGRFAALEPAAQKALDYFAAQNPQESSDADLLRHVKALLHVGDFWIEAARPVEAKRALHAAHERTSVLAARGAADTEIKLLRGRVEAAMALILRRQGEDAAARVWTARQRTTMDSMFGRTDGTARWQHDLLQRQQELAEQALAGAPPSAIGQSHLDELAARARNSIEAPAMVRPRERNVSSDR